MIFRMADTSQIQFKIANLEAEDYDDLRVLLYQNSIDLKDETHRGPAEAWQVLQATVSFLWEHKAQVGSAFGLGKALYEWVKNFRQKQQQLPAPQKVEERPRVVIAYPGDLQGIDILNDDDEKVRTYLLERNR